MQAASSRSGHRMVADLSSLPLQIALHCNVYFFVLFWLGELLMYIYKGVILPFPDQSGTLALEFILLFIFGFIEGIRLLFAYKGNLAERKVSLLWSLVLTIPIIFLDLYLLLWQTYVLRLEVILCSILLVFIGFEAVLSLAAMWTFQRHESFIRQ